MKQPYIFDGIEYPSVTTVLNILGKGDALLGWAAKCAIDYVRQQVDAGMDVQAALVDAAGNWKTVRNEAADIGTEIHDLIHKYIQFGRDAAGIIRPEVANGFLAFLDWESRHKVEWIKVEMAVVSRMHGFAGRLDAICSLLPDPSKSDRKKYLIDFKSSKDFYDGFDMQLAAYRIGAAELGEQTEGCGILRLDKATGVPDWKDYTDKQDAAQAAFLALLRFYYLQKNRRLKNNPHILKPTTKKEIEVLI
jgi:hypothetical protein